MAQQLGAVDGRRIRQPRRTCRSRARPTPPRPGDSRRRRQEFGWCSALVLRPKSTPCAVRHIHWPTCPSPSWPPRFHAAPQSEEISTSAGSKVHPHVQPEPPRPSFATDHIYDGCGTTPRRTLMNSRIRQLAIIAIAAGIGLSGTAAWGTVAPGTPGKDVTRARQRQRREHVHPAARRHRQAAHGEHRRAVRPGQRRPPAGNLGSDALVAGEGSDILMGGPENFTPTEQRRAPGREGNDINIWAPGDGSDAYVGDKGYDTMIFAPFVPRRTAHPSSSGSTADGFRVSTSRISRTSVRHRQGSGQQLGAQFLVRFEVSARRHGPAEGRRAAPLPEPRTRQARVADLTASTRPSSWSGSTDRWRHGRDRREAVRGSQDADLSLPPMRPTRNRSSSSRPAYRWPRRSSRCRTASRPPGSSTRTGARD